MGEATIIAVAKGRCARGAVLSPLLWATPADELIRSPTTKHFHCLGYADNITIVVRGRFPNVLVETMQIAMNVVDNWCKQERQSANAQKVHVVTFRRKRMLLLVLGGSSNSSLY